MVDSDVVARQDDPHQQHGPTSPFNLLSLAQGLFYLATGIWPLVSIRTFQLVTGPKTDVWLVKTVGVLVAVIGGVLAMAGLRRRTVPEIALLAAGSAVGLAGIDVVYVSKGRIGRVYLVDAVAELALVAGWAVAWLGSRASRLNRRPRT